MTVAVFTFVLLLGNGLKEILGLLVNGQATIGSVFHALGLLIPFVLVFALPMGMLTATLLVFGRFSADQELTAVRASGISLLSLISPILLLSVLLCGLSAYINMEIAPRSRVAYKKITSAMQVKLLSSFIPEGRYVRNYEPWAFYVVQNDGELLHDILITHTTNNIPDSTIRAEHGRVDVTNQQLVITLFNAHQVTMENGTISEGERGKIVLRVDINDNDHPEEKVKLSDMTFTQLQKELNDIETSFSLPLAGHASSAELRHQQQLIAEIKTSATMPVLVQMHREVATSFACFGFTLIGIPLGIRAHRRETNVGIFMALILVFVYYAFLIIGQSLQTHANLAPHLILWIPNFLFQAVGAVMLWRANKGV